MTITTDEKYLLNNKMGAVANKVQLGTLIQNAESVTAGEIALADGTLLVGNVSGVGAAVTPSGDVTITNAGVTAIGAKKVVEAMVALANHKILIGDSGGAAAAMAVTGDITISDSGVTAIGAAKVTEAMMAATTTTGLFARRMAHAVFDPTGVSGDRGTGAHASTAIIPDKSFVTNVWYWVETTFTSAADSATIALHIQAANDVVTAVAISDGGNPWDTSALPVEGTTKVEDVATWLKTTAARAITMTVAVQALTGGKMHVFVEYMTYA